MSEYKVSPVHNEADYQREFDNIHESINPSIKQHIAAKKAVDTMFGPTHRKNGGKLVVSNAHGWLVWYAFALVDVEEFKRKWSPYVDFETGKRKDPGNI